MGHGPDTERLDLLGRSVPPGFDVQVVLLGPGCPLRIDDDLPSDTLIEVDDGEVELALPGGGCRSFGAGDLLWLMGGSLRALPTGPAVVIAISRAARDENSGECRLNTHDDTRNEHDHRPGS